MSRHAVFAYGSNMHVADLERYMLGRGYGAPVIYAAEPATLHHHELRFDYTLRHDLGLVVRGYFVESITSVEDGKRLRVDLNYRF